MVYIILGSEAEAAALRTAINTYTAALPELAASTSNTHIIALENREQEAYFNSALSLSSELAAFGIGQRVIDLREKAQRTIQAGAEGFGAGAPAEGIIYVVGSSAEKLALEQQIKALVEDGRRRSVILLDGPDGDRLYNLMAAEQMANGGFEVVDLRN